MKKMVMMLHGGAKMVGGSRVGLNLAGTMCSGPHVHSVRRFLMEGTSRLAVMGGAAGVGGAGCSCAGTISKAARASWHHSLAVRLQACSSAPLRWTSCMALERRNREIIECRWMRLSPKSPRRFFTALPPPVAAAEVAAVERYRGTRRARKRGRDGMDGRAVRGQGVMMSISGGGGGWPEEGKASSRLWRPQCEGRGGGDDGDMEGREAQQGAATSMSVTGGEAVSSPSSSSSSHSPRSSSAGRGSPKGFGGGGGGKNNSKKPTPQALLRAISEVSRSDGRQCRTRNLVLGGGDNEILDNDWKRLDSAVNEYPSLRGFTAIGSGGEDFVQSMVSAVESVLQVTVSDRSVQRRLSEKGNFVSVKIGPVRVDSGEQVLAVYSAMKKDGRMCYFL